MDKKTLLDWVDNVKLWNEWLKGICENIDKKTEQYQNIEDIEQIDDAVVDLLFIRNRLEHMIGIWLGEEDD